MEIVQSAAEEHWEKCEAVSYTHLDVYKRQSLHSAKKEMKQSITLTIIIIPVSYTHLDVYKRQEHKIHERL